MPDSLTTSPPTAKLALPVSADVLSLCGALSGEATSDLGSFDLAGRTVQILASRDDIWALVRRPGAGALAIRAAHLPGGGRNVRLGRKKADEALRVFADSESGTHRIGISVDSLHLPSLRITHELTPATDLLIAFLPRDLYPLDDDLNAAGATGQVEAAQRGLNSAVCYFRFDKPAFGTVLYFQNLTAMADYYEATDTKPDGAVGGLWPELGYLPPTPPQSAEPPSNPLKAGEPVMVSDALVIMHDDPHPTEQSSARRFLQMLASAYRQIELPPVEYRDWVARSKATLRDLAKAPEARVNHYGHHYVRPYTAAEYPDIMVQTTIVAALHDWAGWQKSEVELEGTLAAGVPKFYDPKLGTLRRYLPNVGKDKNKDAVDSWYLYQPLLYLGRLALDGDRRSKRLFLKGLDYAMRAAKHFDYKWPIQFDVETFDVLVEARNKDGLGQTDVGGLYAYVMVHAFRLTGDQRYLEEAQAALDAARGMRFELEYQANLTAWGAAACMALWRITDRDDFLQRGYVYLASFFHNCQMWESNIKNARYYENFLGATCLHDAPYMAIFECADSFAALEAYLKDAGPDLDPAVRMLVAEYCRYALSRAWNYYPDTLPPEILCDKPRNGHIDRNLSFPVEDLYADGQKAGQVGQEVYGAGAAFIFASRAFHRVEGAPFLLYCDHFITASERTSKGSLVFQLTGGDACEALLCLVRDGRRKLPKVTVRTADGDRLRARHQASDRIEFRVPANGQLILDW